jgi:hypothetical protein
MTVRIDTEVKTGWAGKTPAKSSHPLTEDYILKRCTVEELLELNGRRSELNYSQLGALDRGLARL